MSILFLRGYNASTKIAVFDVCKEVWIDEYVMQDSTYDAENNLSNRQPHQVGFPVEKLEVGDTLELHLTKKYKHGDFLVETLSDGKKRLVVCAHFDRIINKTGDILKLVRIVEEFRLPSSDR